MLLALRLLRLFYSNTTQSNHNNHLRTCQAGPLAASWLCLYWRKQSLCLSQALSLDVNDRNQATITPLCSATGQQLPLTNGPYKFPWHHGNSKCIGPNKYQLLDEADLSIDLLTCQMIVYSCPEIAGYPKCSLRSSLTGVLAKGCLMVFHPLSTSVPANAIWVILVSFSPK